MFTHLHDNNTILVRGQKNDIVSDVHLSARRPTAHARIVPTAAAAAAARCIVLLFIIVIIIWYVILSNGRRDFRI